MQEISVRKLQNSAYTKEFENYLRYGTPITVPYYVFAIKATGYTHYIWRTRLDGKVRPAHADNEGKVFEWSKPPHTGHPGHSHGCRCTAENITASFNPNLEPFILLEDIATWPKPPIDGNLTEGLPSRSKARSRGGRSLWDQYGGEWRPHLPEKQKIRHNLHWDYKAAGRTSRWLNIPINNKPTKLPEN